MTHACCKLVVALAATLPLLAGCSRALTSRELPKDSDLAAASNSDRSTAATSPGDASKPSSTSLAATSPDGSTPQNFGEVFTELEQIGKVDPQLKQQLIADLNGVQPSMWRQTIQVYRGALAYRDQAAQRDAENRADTSAEIAPADERQTVGTAPNRRVGRRRASSHNPPPPSLPEFLASPTDAQTTRAVSEHAAINADRESFVASADLPAGVRALHTTVQAARVAAPPPTDGGWRSHLELAIRDLQARTNEPPRSANEVRQHAASRMLHAVAGHREQALRPIAGVSPTQQDFWSKQIYALDTMLDQERIPDPSRRAAEARRHLDEASAKLGAMGSLTVRNLAFCRKVTTYGVYRKFDRYEFQPREEVLLYAEIDNFKSEETDEGFHTALRSSYQILDSKGTRVTDHEFEVTEEHCQTRRRDFFMRYYVWMPKRIYDGEYTLQLTIEDVKSQKIGTATIDFRIKEERSEEEQSE